MGPTNKELSIIMKMRDEVTKKITTIQGKMIKFGNDIKRHFLGAAAGIAGMIVVVKKFTDAAAREEDAIKKLNTQLQLNGEYSESTSRELREFAANLQDVTRFGDEAILEQLAFAQAMGATAEQSKIVVEAGADMAASLNMDLNTAVRNAAKTLGGYSGELGEVIPELKNLTQEQLRAGEGVRLISKLFAGAAKEDVNTFSGVIDQLGNNFGDLMEGLGSFITESPAVKTALKFWSDTFAGIASAVKGMQSHGEGMVAQIEFMEKRVAAIQERIENFHLNAKKSGGYTPKELIKINELITEQARINRTILRMKKEINQQIKENTEAEEENNIVHDEKMKKIDDETKKWREMASQLNDQDNEKRARFEEMLKGNMALLQEWRNIEAAAFSDISQLAASALNTFHQGASSALSDLILGVKTTREAFSALGQQMVKVIVDWLAQKAVAFVIEQTMGAAMTALTSTMAVSLAAAWAPAAALASLATLGGNAAPAIAGIGATVAVAQGAAALSAKPMARGGDEVVTKPTLYLAGEAGPERATFRPLGGPFKGGGMQDGVTINIGPVYQQPGENTEELARRLGDYAFRQRRYYGLT